MRRYDESVEVRPGQVDGLAAPEQFLWRGRLWKVRGVLAHWVETGEWWHSGHARSARGDESGSPATLLTRPVAELLGEREVWRVEAGLGGPAGRTGVFELGLDRAEESWRLLGCTD